jgi:pimeloyl-ACP methyl ester carboxylesterase
MEAALRSDDLFALILYEPPVVSDVPPEIEQLVEAVKALVANGEKEQALITELTAVGTPEAALEELRSSQGWQALVDAADTIPREFEGFFEYEFDTDRFEGMTTPTVLFSGGESHPDLVAAAKAVNETLPDSRIVVFDGHGHFAMTSATDRFIDEVRAFIQESN